MSNFRDRVLIDLLRWAPKGTLSRLMGACARTPLPKSVRPAVYRGFANRFGANLDEVERPLVEYKCLDDFFTRRLKPGARSVDSATDVVVSPCDGTPSQWGPLVEGESLIQAKGVNYSASDLLQNEEQAQRFYGGEFLTIYLAPRHYHRVHFAVSGPVVAYQHVPGEFYPVNAAAVDKVDGLFAKNERVVTYQDTDAGPVATVMVAATGVGNMRMCYADIKTNMSGHDNPQGLQRLEGVVVQKGDELGVFHQGSTVIMLFPKGAVRFADMQVGQELLQGECIASAISRQGREGARA